MPEFLIIFSLDKLLDVEYDLNDGIFVTQWAAYLRTALHQSENIQVVTEASRCLGMNLQTLKLLWKTLRPNIFIHYEVYYDHLNYICLSTRYFIKYRAKEVLQIVLLRDQNKFSNTDRLDYRPLSAYISAHYAT